MGTATTGLWILGGFLGSGKTTLLNHLLARMSDSRIGVVVNDFGKLNVDTSLIEGVREDEVVELNGGQIFCSCLSGSFVHSIEQLAGHDLDAILVESSGLAKPSALKEIIELAHQSTDGRVTFRGHVGVVDAERFSMLIEAVNAVEEQIYYSDLLVINKTDLVDEEELARIRERVSHINPDCRIVETVRGELDPSDLPGSPAVPAKEFDNRFMGWGKGGRPKAILWQPERRLTDAQLEAAVRHVAESAYRIKGYITTAEGARFVSTSGDQISIHETQTEPREWGLTVIVPPRVVTTKLFNEAIELATQERSSIL